MSDRRHCLQADRKERLLGKRSDATASQFRPEGTQRRALAIRASASARRCVVGRSSASLRHLDLKARRYLLRCSIRLRVDGGSLISHPRTRHAAELGARPQAEYVYLGCSPDPAPASIILWDGMACRTDIPAAMTWARVMDH